MPYQTVVISDKQHTTTSEQRSTDGILPGGDIFAIEQGERPVYTEGILPNLLALVGELEGEAICDMACGQGWVARELARRGAQVTGLDLAPNLLALARDYEEQEPLGIRR